MDELAVGCGIDPIELRIRNEPDVDPETGNPWSTAGSSNACDRAPSGSAGRPRSAHRERGATASGWSAPASPRPSTPR